MAIIGNAFNLERTDASQSYAYKCWYNYKYEGNTMHITNYEFNHITQNWQSEITNWEAHAQKDDNAYEIEDFETSSAYKDSYQNSKDVSGHDGNTNVDLGVGIASGLTSLGGGTLAGLSLFSSALNVGFKADLVGSYVITCPIVLAVGILYEATQPNKKAHAALMELEKLMQTGQNNMISDYQRLDTLDYELLASVETVQDGKDEREDTLEEKRKLIEEATAMLQVLQARVASGEKLSKGDLEMLTTVIPDQLATLQEEYDTLQAESIKTGEDELANMEDKQTEFDSVADSIATEKATTDFAASFDNTTKTLASMQIATHSLNIVSGGIGMAKAIAASLPTFGTSLVFATMAGLGMLASGHAIIQQSKFLKDINGEIETRGLTEGEIDTTTDHLGDKTNSAEFYASDVLASTEEIEEFEFEELVEFGELVEASVSSVSDIKTEGDTSSKEEEKPLVANAGNNASADGGLASGADSSNENRVKKQEQNPFA